MQKLTTAQELQTRLSAVLATVETEFSPLTDAQLRWKPAPDSWSILECLQHLNLAERFYIRNIQHKVDKLGLLQANPADQVLNSDWIGKAMLYAVDPQVKMKIPAPGMVRPRPAADLVPTEVMSQFVELQTLLRTLLDKAVYLDWNQDKVMTLFGNWLKIRLGDAFLMLVAHTERHMKQAMRVKAEMATFATTTNNL
ncbi:DinB family protein [Spirosoma sp. KCTC 42546]|uniref:DinB family protein n=1 Tax=Spirosoma sp. KCTC 42546 TaxID=2520506 RepID=UPI00115934E6|nr:DinB family protein [Spirosoma sp. KCTC 42546]QDK80389.1 DinB family protein [Spirosoma sp. KCTC 42546]